jgi:succinate-acetate transporter protein
MSTTEPESTLTPRHSGPAAAVLPSIADPGPLGLAGFAMTTFVLSMFNSGLVGAAGSGVVLGLALAYGGGAQLLAGMWEFKRNNTFGALAFSSYGAFWISFFFLQRYTPVAAITGKGVGLYLIAWAIFTAYMIVPTLRLNVGLVAVFVFLTLTFLFLGIGAARGSTGTTHFGGYLGLITAILAWYCSFAGVTNSTFGRVVLPLVPLTGRPATR